MLNHLLRVGGTWINVGPLLWHYENSGGSSSSSSGSSEKDASSGSKSSNDLSIELTLEEVMDLLPKMGFEVVERRTLPPQTYTGNAKGMLTYDYHPEFWVAKKVRDVPFAPAV